MTTEPHSSRSMRFARLTASYGLEPFIGSRARVSEVMARRRPLTFRMIRRLAVGLEIPTNVLIPSYRTVDHRAA
ncbi:MAG: hypothetical protein ACREYF_07185 [Gammaproteobacteria bacterium]